MSSESDLPTAELDAQQGTLESYERIPYRTHAWTSCQPARLETVARLWGVEAAPADRCRVAELGCGDGGNLIPLAIAHPESHFVGIDLAPGHVEAGRRLIEQLELPNVELRAQSFVDMEAGEFDYVIAHGLMSWVTPHLQERLFETMRRLLAPLGIAFASYNTYPGWYMQHSIRELLRHHNRDVDDVELALDRSRELLDALIATVPGSEDAYRTYLESVGAVARNPERRYYFAHEYLEDENHPFYVRDFIERAAQHGLDYLGDADLVDMELENMPEEPSARLEQLAGTRAERLQMLDYAVNRKFRQSLLCRTGVEIPELPDLASISGMHVASSLEPDERPVPVEGDDVARFSDRHGRSVDVDQPIVKAALLHLADHPSTMPAFGELIERSGHADADEEQRRILALILVRLFLADVIELRASPPCWATGLPDRPRASPLVRLHAEAGGTTTSLRHRSVALDNEAVCGVLALLDGSRTRAELATALADQLASAEIDLILELAVRNGVLFR